MMISSGSCVRIGYAKRFYFSTFYVVYDTRWWLMNRGHVLVELQRSLVSGRVDILGGGEV